MGRIISTSSTNTRHKHKKKTSEHKHTHHHHQQQQQHFIKVKQIQTHYEDYWIDCIYFDASSCCYGFNGFCRGMDQPCYVGDLMIRHGKIHENKCCWNGRMLSGDRVAKCQNKPSNPNDCFAPRQKKEIKHGETMGKNCCWQGIFLSKAKCETQVSHPDNCYAAKLGKEIKHGE